MPVHLLVIAVEHLGVLHCAADVGLSFNLQFQEGVGVEVINAHIAVFQAELHLVAVGAFHRIVAHQFRRVPFLFVIDQRAVNVRIFLQTLQIVSGEEFGVAPSLKGIHLPTRLAVVGLDLREALDDRLFADFVRALIFLQEAGAEPSGHEFSGGADGIHRLEFLHAPVRLDVFGDHFVHRLGRAAFRKKASQRQQCEDGQKGSRRVLPMEVSRRLTTVHGCPRRFIGIIRTDSLIRDGRRRFAFLQTNFKGLC